MFANDANFGEKSVATGVWATMKAKTKSGMGVRTRTTRKKRKSRGRQSRQYRVLPGAKRGGFHPLLLPALSAIGALAGGVTGNTKAVNDAQWYKITLFVQITVQVVIF